jgi:gamma-glutamylcyclotransferase (GGCT)/AIG2-like uncharacterized protein YtfP
MTDMLTRPARTGDTDTDDTVLFAVYGTLRTGCGNDILWRDRAESLGLATVPDYALVVPSWQAGFPFAVPQRGHRIVVELLRPLPEHRAALTRRLDELEGVPTLYTRDEAVSEVDGGYVFTWLYVASQSTQAHRLGTALFVPDGDWVQFTRNRRDTFRG